MASHLSQSQLAKYAARLQGMRLFPLFREWQVKRAIRKLVSDGSPKALSALEEGRKTGLLSKSPYKEVYNLALAHEPRLEPGKASLDSIRSEVLLSIIGNEAKPHVNTEDTLKAKPFPVEEAIAPEKAEDPWPHEDGSPMFNDYRYDIDEAAQQAGHGVFSREEELPSGRLGAIYHVEQGDPEDSIKEEQLEAQTQDLGEAPQSKNQPDLASREQDVAKLSDKAEKAEKARIDINEVDHLWIEKLDQYVCLEYEERLRIISEIAKSDRSIDDWIDELLYQQEAFTCEEDASHYSTDSQWLEDIDFGPSKPRRDAAEGRQPQRCQEERFGIDSNENASLGAARQSENSFLLANPNESASSGNGTSAGCQEQERIFPFVYKTKDDILRIINCHPSALKKAAKELRCKAPFSLVDADRLAYALTGDASIRRVYMRRLEELNSLGQSAGIDEPLV